MSKVFTLKQDILWYKKGEKFYYQNGSLYHDDNINPPIRTLDNLQNAIAGHFEDEGIEEYFDISEDGNEQGANA